MTVVRKARPADAPSLAEMNYEFNRVRRRPSAIARSLSSRNEIVLAATVDGEAAGFACGRTYGSFCYPEPQAELTELYVRQRYRRMGIATRLCRAVEAEAARRGAIEIHLLTNVRNRRARALYRKLGYAAKRHADYAKRIGPG